MNTQGLKQFLIESNKAGYVTGDEKRWIKEPDSSTTIPYSSKDWKAHDNFFGGEPYGGRIIVFYKNKPHWIMVYYGWVKEGIDPNPVYSILRNELKNMPEDAPFRGPKEYKENNFIYTNSWSGNIEKYRGEEKIIQNNTLFYKAHYMGGLVDKRGGL